MENLFTRNASGHLKEIFFLTFPIKLLQKRYVSGVVGRLKKEAAHHA